MAALLSMSAFLADVGLGENPNIVSRGPDINVLPPLASILGGADTAKDIDSDISASFGTFALHGLLIPSLSTDSEGADWCSVGNLPPLHDVSGDGITASFSKVTLHGPPVPSLPEISGGLLRASSPIGKRKKRNVSKKMKFLRNAVRAQLTNIALV